MRNFCLLLVCIFIFSCKRTQPDAATTAIEVDESFGRYISEYTRNDVSVSQDLTFRFSGAIVKLEEIGSKVDSDLYAISPNVKGKAYWKDMSTIIFDPEENLDYGQSYVFSIKLGSIFDNVPDNLRQVKIPFFTSDLSYEIRFNALNYDNSDDEQLTISGRIKSSDVANDEAVEKFLEVSQKGNKDLDILWNHKGRYHNFEIANVKRYKKPSELKIEWNDSSSGFKGSKRLDILGQGEFKIISAETLKGNDRRIRVYFSKPLLRTQNLEGLVQINGYKGKLKYDINGSQVSVYPEGPLESPFQVKISNSITSRKGDSLKEGYETNLSFDPIKPQVRLLGKGVIVPHSEEIIFPFEAINLKGATVEIFKIYDDNVLQFLQYNRLGSTYNLNPVGKIVHQEEIKLNDLNKDENAVKFVRYALDLRKLISPDPGSIYQVRIGFKMKDIVEYPCEEEEEIEATVVANRGGFSTILNNPRYDGYRWEHREDPCKKGYYNSSRVVTRNVLASNIGAIVKKAKDNTVDMVLTDLKTLNPLSGAQISFFNYQQQEIASTSSGVNGMSSTFLDESPSFAIVNHGGDYGYLNIQDKHANSLSEFEVSGRAKKKGIDGYIYGERGVWRPGDTIFLNFVLEDKSANLPIDHPVVLTIKDARGKEKLRTSTSSNVGQVYNFPIATSDKDPTGNWTATVKVGGATFQKTLKVETVKPNRLKIRYDLEENSTIALFDNKPIGISSEWLHGAPANGLKAKVDLQLVSSNTSFKGFGEYKFMDPARKINAQPLTVFEKKLDENGKGSIKIQNNKKWLAPGKLRANFKTKVFEKGGNFSEDNFSMPADIYSSYVGIKIPKTRWGSKFIKIDKPTDIPIVLLDTEGKPLSNRKLTVGLYKAKWNWWYSNGYSDKYSYNHSSHKGAVSTNTITTDAQGKAMHNVEFDDWGNYMIRVCDEVSGHCTGDMFYTGRSWSNRGEQEGPQMLLFKANKPSYKVGESIQVSIPSNKGSRILISIENGEKVLQKYWVDGTQGETKIDITATEEMNSNVYIHAHLIQPHNNGENDLPMRMYGVVPVSVISPISQLSPEIVMPDKLKPNESFELKVSESSGKPMVYTVAVVDDGLLDLTRYKTPDLWNHFHSKQALGVKTWDIYDMVLNSYGGMIDRLISIGGDAMAGRDKNNKKANRFVPVVRHLGPFYLQSGETKAHKISLPNYVGSVRTMVVARHDASYGKAEKTTQVKKPLMILSTLPRVLGPSEKLVLPTNVFAMEPHVKDVQVSVETTDNVSITGPVRKKLSFDRLGDKQAYFDMEVGNNMGLANVKVRAQGNGEGAFEEVNIDIRNPNPYTSKVIEGVIQPGEEWATDYELFGTMGSNEGVLELSNIPPMNFGRRLKYLIRYPYGCIEQTTSSVFPQLFLKEVTDLDAKQVYKTERNIERGIERLSLFQLSNGGFSYWPGKSSVSAWGTNYAGHFLLEAKEKGYFISERMLNDFVKYQDNVASTTDLPSRVTPENRHIIPMQAYRLYTLAKAGSPNIGAMNRMRNYNHLTTASAHMLGAAYAIIGKKQIGKDLVANRDMTIDPYAETGYTYGSHLRDMAMMAEAQQIIGNANESAQLIKQISRDMASQRWYSTQTTAYALLSIGKFLSSYEKDDLSYEYSINNGTLESGKTAKPTLQKSVEVENTSTKRIKVKNTSKNIMYTRFVLSGQKPPGTGEDAHEKHIKLKVSYTDMEGKAIDPTRIKQGTDFIATVNVQNIGSRARNIKEVALSQIFASGWEIQNARMSSMSNVAKNSTFEYRDVRDDRVYTFFDIYGTSELTYSVLLNATYAGKFYLAPVYVEAMYDNEIQAKEKGQWVEVY